MERSELDPAPLPLSAEAGEDTVIRRLDYRLNGKNSDRRMILLIIGLLLVGGIAISLSILQTNRQRVEQETMIDFELHSRMRASAIQQMFEHHTQVVEVTGQFVAAANEVTQQEFTTFTAPLLAKEPDMRWVMWIVADPSQHSWLIRQSQPVNQAWRDFDVATSLGPLLRQTRESGSQHAMLAMAPIPGLLAKDDLLLLQPIYRTGSDGRKKFLGIVASATTLRAMIRDALHLIPVTGIDLLLHDVGTDTRPPLFVHRSPLEQAPADVTQTVRQWKERYPHYIGLPLAFADQHWELLFFPTSVFIERHGVRYPWLLFLSALLTVTLSIVAVLLVWLRQQRSEQLADKLDNSNRELRRHQSRLNRAQRAGRLGFWELNPLDGTLYRSAQARVIFGDAPDSTLDLNHWLSCIHPDDRERVEAELDRASQIPPKPFQIEYRFLLPDGEVLYLHDQGEMQIDSEQGPLVLGVVQDITRLRESEELLQRTQWDFRAIFEHMQDVFYRTDREGQITLISPSAERLFGYTHTELVGSRVADFYADPAGREEFLRKLEADGGRLIGYEAEMRHRSGRSVWVSTNANYWYDASGRIGGVEGMARDISNRRERDALLRKLVQAIEQSGEAIIITDVHGSIEYVNPAFCRLSGYLQEEAIGAKPNILKSGAQHDDYYRHLWETLAQGKRWQGQMVDRAKDGHLYPVLASISPIQDNHGRITHFVAIQQDLTEQQRLEEQLRQAQKMEAIGRLVGGIAHDFNNMLAGIVGNSYLARAKVNDPLKVSEKLANIDKLAARAAEMIRHLLTFARQDSVDFSPMSLNDLLKDVVKLTSAAIPESIAHRLEICTEEVRISGNATQLQQMVMNLISNACDALDGAEQPCIEIRLRRLSLPHSLLQSQPELTPGEYGCLTVSDNGSGIPHELLAKIFEPFFTTKQVGKGTGLGLAMVYGGMHNHKGAVEVVSSPGNGTTFNLWFPLAPESVTAGGEHFRQIESGQGELILLADDQLEVRETMTSVLRDLGYEVLVARNGREAIALFEEQLGCIDLLLTDVVMPELGGVETAIALRQTAPALPILFMTGYDRSDRMEKYLFNANEAITASIGKPCDIGELTHLLLRLLHR